MQRASRLQVMLLVFGLLAVSLYFSPSTQAVQQHKCVGDLKIAFKDVQSASTKRVVLTVHGYNDSLRAWQGDGSIEKALQRVDEVVTFHFNYEKANDRWVTDSEIAPKLAKYIACYHLLSKRPVILLAHSMGGLAAREALDSAAYGVRIKNAVGHVITIGTPHKGSLFANLDSGFGFDICKSPFRLPVASECEQINAATATGGMQVGSEQLAKLAHFPPGILVKAIAGEVSWRACLPWGCSPATNTGGDLVVPVASATAEYTQVGYGDGKKVFACETSSWLISPWADAWCDHNKMLRAPQVQSEVSQSIRDYLRYAKLAETGAQFVGEWNAEATALEFDAGGAGRQIIKLGACLTGNPDFECRVTIEFSWKPANNGLTYTVQSVSAIAEPILGAIISIENEIDMSRFEQPGATLHVEFKSTGLIERDPGGAHYWPFCYYPQATVKETKLCSVKRF